VRGCHGYADRRGSVSFSESKRRFTGPADHGARSEMASRRL